MVISFTLKKKLVLLVRKNKRKWKVPGGGIEFGEAPKIAAIREVDEEVGMNEC